LSSGGPIGGKGKELYDESWRRMDEWLVDGMDMDLGVDQRFGRIPPDRRD
jgi:hypothetical protein